MSAYLQIVISHHNPDQIGWASSGRDMSSQSQIVYTGLIFMQKFCASL